MNHRCGWLLALAALAVSSGARAATCSSGTQGADAVVMAQHKAYVAHDLDAFAACYADDVVITDLSRKREPIVGKAALREVYGSLFKRMPAGFRSEYVGKLINGPVVVVSERSVNTRSGSTPSGMAMFEVRHGKIIHVWFGPFE